MDNRADTTLVPGVEPRNMSPFRVHLVMQCIKWHLTFFDSENLFTLDIF